MLGPGIIGTIPVTIDKLSAWFILAIDITMITGTLYGYSYLKAYQHMKTNLSVHWTALIFLHLGMLGVFILRNSIAFIISWEIMAVSAFFLVIFESSNSHTIKAGMNYLIQTHIGVVFLMMAFLWVFVAEGSTDFEAIRTFFASHTNRWLFILFFIGFGFKAGFIPMHSWLPHAHPAAPSHISGIMSGLILKTGIYGILRMITYLNNDFLILGRTVLIIALLTGLFGIINAAVHRDIKRMLAYCTIENIGIIGIGTGLGLIGLGSHNNLLVVLGFGSALLHTLNHSLFKSLLFFSVGSVYLQTHTRDMEHLGGLIKTMPFTAAFFLIGAIAVAGLPPFSGFISEFMLYAGFFKSLGHAGMYNSVLIILSIAIIALIGGMSIFTFSRTFGVAFLGNSRYQTEHLPTEVKFISKLPQYITVGLILLIAFSPLYFINITLGVINSVFPHIGFPNSLVHEGVFNLMNSIWIYSMVFTGIVVAVILIRAVIVRFTPRTVATTWGCGYIAPKPTMQYTGKSFSKTFGKILNFMIFEQKRFAELDRNEVFPKTRKHSSHFADYFELRWFTRIINALLSGMNRFQFIQNGLLQRYILYGLFFIIVVLTLTFLNIL